MRYDGVPNLPESSRPTSGDDRTMFRLSRLGLLAAAALAFVASSTSAQVPTLGTIERNDPAFNSLVPENSVIELLVRDKFEWSEGPVWDKANKRLLFSDIPRNMIWQWSAEGGLKDFLKPSGYTGS